MEPSVDNSYIFASAHDVSADVPASVTELPLLMDKAVADSTAEAGREGNLAVALPPLGSETWCMAP